MLGLQTSPDVVDNLKGQPMRNIDWDAPLTDDDRAWLVQRLTPDLISRIKDNEERFSVREPVRVAESGGEDNGETETGAKVEAESEFEDDYDKWKVDELKAECEGREPPIDLTGITKKADLIAALRTWDAEHPDAEEV